MSIQAQIINLLTDLQAEFDLSYIVIAHDLAVVEHLCDRVAVMYLGKIVESGAYGDIYNDPKHPYTQALLSAVPVPDPDAPRNRVILGGDVPSPLNPRRGCNFHPRCPRRLGHCDQSRTGVGGCPVGTSCGLSPLPVKGIGYAKEPYDVTDRTALGVASCGKPRPGSLGVDPGR